MSKICNLCNENKDLSEFHKDKKFADGLHYRCKACVKQYTKNYHTKNRDTLNLKKKEYKQNNKDKVKSWTLKSDYGIDLVEYNKMFVNQSGMCKICERHQSDLEKALAVDHNHKTGEIRGLLCHVCNRAIGLLQDSPIVVMAAYKYLSGIKDE